jgi:hypothetical protein
MIPDPGRLRFSCAAFEPISCRNGLWVSGDRIRMPTLRPDIPVTLGRACLGCPSLLTMGLRRSPVFLSEQLAVFREEHSFNVLVTIPSAGGKGTMRAHRAIKPCFTHSLPFRPVPSIKLAALVQTEDMYENAVFHTESRGGTPKRQD